MIKKLTSIALAVTVVVTGFGMGTDQAFAEYEGTIDAFTYGDYEIPAYDGDAAEVINNNDPEFEEGELVEAAAEQYGALDSLGRCTSCAAILNQSLMPTYKRGSISTIKPTGWIQATYDIVPAGYLYNRCHLIGFQLTGVDNENEKKIYAKQDLITGTRYLNVGTGGGGMVLYENAVADYIKADPENYMAYRVTPVFEGEDKVAKGVIMEGESIGDDQLEFCVFCYNLQPGIEIDYATGQSRLAGDLPLPEPIDQCDITLAYESLKYRGSARKPAVTVVHEGQTLAEGRDYTLSYSNNLNVGTAKVTITGIGDFAGSTTKTFKITPASLTAKKVVLSATSYVYNGNLKKPLANIDGLKYGVDYKVTYSQNRYVGKANVKVVGIGNYTGTVISHFKILPKGTSIKSLTPASGAFTAKWYQQSTQAAGYQLRYSRYSSMKSAKSAAVAKSTTLSKKITGLTAKRKYYVQIRTFKTVDGVKYYSGWSKIKYVTTK